MKITLTIFLTLILIYGCNYKQDKSHSDVKINKIEDQAINNNLEQLEIGCYYELDDKYSDSKNKEEIEKWWNNKLKLIKKSGIQNDILSRDGGGPNGAEWNTYTNLYFAFVVPTETNLKKSEDLHFDPITITINDKPINHKSIRKKSFDKGMLVDFMLEKEIWTNALRSIEPKDYIPLFGKERVEKAHKGEPVFMNQMDTGEIFKLCIELELTNREKIKVTDFFHISYGE